jgi:small subunit ribosomal protein S6
VADDMVLRGGTLQPSCHGWTVTALDRRRWVISMRQYELMIILDPDLEERTIQPSLDKFLSVVTKDNGTVDNVDLWGKRRLAYDIKKKSEGIYAVVTFSAESATAKELDRQLGLNESILRTKLLRPGA